MKIYIVERDNPQCWEEPQVYMDGKEAVEAIREEYEAQMSELGTSQKYADDGLGGYGCYWEIDEEQLCGSCLIDSDYDGDRWQWRLTEHEI